MTFRDTIQQYNQTKHSDGMGGFVPDIPVIRNLRCKASLSTRPEDFTAYGTKGEKVLYVISPEALDKEAFYLFNGIKYDIRVETYNTRLFYYTLVEIK